LSPSSLLKGVQSTPPPADIIYIYTVKAEDLANIGENNARRVMTSTIKDDFKNLSMLNLKLDKKNLSYKFKKISDNSSWVIPFLVLIASIIGTQLATMAVTLSMVIQLF